MEAGNTEEVGVKAWGVLKSGGGGGDAKEGVGGFGEFGLLELSIGRLIIIVSLRYEYANCQ